MQASISVLLIAETAKQQRRLEKLPANEHAAPYLQDIDVYVWMRLLELNTRLHFQTGTRLHDVNNAYTIQPVQAPQTPRYRVQLITFAFNITAALRTCEDSFSDREDFTAVR